MGRAKIIPPNEALMLPFQGRYVRDDSRLILVEKSRQIGFSWAAAYKKVRAKSLRTCRYDTWISSRDEIQARLFLDDCKSFAGILDIAAEDLGQRIIDDAKNTALVLQFTNGRRINSMSSNADAQAGKRGDRVLDEFALHPDPRKLYAIAYPGITWGGQMDLISTHRGTANFFNELVLEIKHKGNPKGFSLHTITLQNALDDGFLHRLQSKLPADDARQEMDEAEYFDFIRAGCPDEETFQQEYCCVPSDDASAFLSYELIQGCEYRPEEKWERTLAELAASPHPLYLGGDIGRDHDLTALWVGERNGAEMHVRRRIEMANTPFDEQERRLWELLELPNLRRACLDNTGIGRMLVERAQKRFGEYKVEPVTFTAPVKEELAYPLRSAFEDHAVRIPSDPFIRADLRAVKKETTAAGNIRFSADRGKGGHSDRFWALALLLHAAKLAGGPAWAVALSLGTYEGGTQ